MISTIAKTSEVPDALFNPSSNMVMIPPDPAVSTQTFARARRMRNQYFALSKQLTQTGAGRKLSETTVAGWPCPGLQDVPPNTGSSDATNAGAS
jgi:hypothetical protein